MIEEVIWGNFDLATFYSNKMYPDGILLFKKSLLLYLIKMAENYLFDYI